MANLFFNDFLMINNTVDVRRVRVHYGASIAHLSG